MSELCNGCDLKGNLQGSITKILDTEIGYEIRRCAGFGKIIDYYIGKVAVFADDNNNFSKPIKLDENTEFVDLLTIIEGCSGSEIIYKGRFLLRMTSVSCPALGELAIKNPDIIKLITDNIIETYNNTKEQ